jgi:hypothetical protein
VNHQRRGILHGSCVYDARRCRVEEAESIWVIFVGEHIFVVDTGQ